MIISSNFLLLRTINSIELNKFMQAVLIGYDSSCDPIVFAIVNLSSIILIMFV
jgi:hypothetical protein